MSVSGNRPATQDHFDKVAPGKQHEVRLAVISYKGQSASCNCGWAATHPRSKVLEDKIDRHVERKHNGRAIRV